MTAMAHAHLALLTTLVLLALGEQGGAHAKLPSITLRGYAHLRLNTSDATEVFVVPGVSGQLTPASFGSGIVVDDPFRVTTDGASALVGRIKGHGFNTDRLGSSQYLSIYLTFLIDYKTVTGSVLVQGTSIRTESVRKFAVVGGTGGFELARGIATQHPVSFTNANDGSGALIAINEWKLTVYKEAVGPNLTSLRHKLPELLQV